MMLLRPNSKRRSLAVLLRVAAAATAVAVGGCEPVRAPPPSVSFAGLPVSGSVHDAQKSGFTDCVHLDAVHIRCRRHGVMVDGAGPYDAAVDLVGSTGGGGFDQLTLWDDRDNDAVFRLATALEQGGWTKCLTGDGRVGDQAIYTRAGAPVRASMDISYWSKRRLRFIPVSDHDHGCTDPAAHSVGRKSGTDR